MYKVIATKDGTCDLQSKAGHHLAIGLSLSEAKMIATAINRMSVFQEMISLLDEMSCGCDYRYEPSIRALLTKSDALNAEEL